MSGSTSSRPSSVPGLLLVPVVPTSCNNVLTTLDASGTLAEDRTWVRVLPALLIASALPVAQSSSGRTRRPRRRPERP